MLSGFNYHQPTALRFGAGRVNEVGGEVARVGTRCLLVTAKAWPGVGPLYDRVLASVREAGVEVWHFDEVPPNPTTETIARGAAVARARVVDVVLRWAAESRLTT